MNRVLKIAASVMLALLLFGLGSLAGQSQNERGRRRVPNDALPVRRDAPSQQEPLVSPQAMGADEKLIRDVYARLMRYQTAGREEVATTTGKPSEPKDYLTFELQSFHSGPIEEISGRPLDDMVTARSGAILVIKSTHLGVGKEMPHAYYHAEWATVSNGGEKTDKRTLADKKFAGLNRYILYEVTARLGGRERSYKALALYQFQTGGGTVQAESTKPAQVEILDNIASEMNTVLKDESPRVHSPWSKYVKSSLYLAVAKAIREAKEAGRPLIPDDAPLGYLPGDDAKIDPGAALAPDARSVVPLAEVTAVNYIENIVAPFNSAWGAMRPTTWSVDIDVRFDCPNNRWVAVVSKADSEYEIFYRLLSGVSEASVAASTAPNHCKMISDLNALGNVTNVQWYMVSAVEAHERVHITEWRSSLNPEFTTMKTTIEALTVSHTAGMTAGDAITQIKAMPAYANAVTGARTRATTTFNNIADPNAQTNAAEHGVVDPMVTSIRAHATTQGWAACPP